MDTREGKREARRSRVQARPDCSLSVLRFSSAIEWFGERRKNASIGCASVQQQQERARASALFLGDNPFFLAPSSFLSRDVRSVRTFFSIPFEETDSSSLSLRCVARASGPISSWTSHHSITLSMPVRPCLPRAHCPCAADTRVVVRLIIVHQFLSTGCLAIEFDYREERLQYSSKLRVHSFYMTQSKAKFTNSTFYKLRNLTIDLVTSTR